MTDHVPLCLFSQHCQSIGIIVVLKKEAVGIQTLFTWFCMLDQNQFLSRSPTPVAKMQQQITKEPPPRSRDGSRSVPKDTK